MDTLPGTTQKSSWIKEHAALLIVICIAGIAHMVNMFGFPAYREDEGTYMSQAWAVVHEQRLASYTYWYDHAPAGWILIAIWTLLNGSDFFVGGLAVNSGRLLMAVLQIINTYFVFCIVHNITKKKTPSVIASLLFALTPLSIILHRRVLLDNIMLFWFIWSLYLLTKTMKLKNIILSAITFALAVLSKESAAPFIFGMIAIVVLQSHKNNKQYAIVIWTSISLLLISLYPLFALLKGEFFPAGTYFGGLEPHVSLLDALKFHITRNAGNSFTFTAKEVWFSFAPLFLIVSTIATVTHLFFIKKRWPFLIALLSISYILFIMRGQVLDWYIIPLLPLFSISIALLYDHVESFVKNIFLSAPSRAGMLAIIALVLGFELSNKFYIFSLDQTYNQVEAVKWTKNNLPTDSLTLIDNYPFVDLNPNLQSISNTTYHYYWKADTDPQVRYDILNNDWSNINYLLFTPALSVSIYNDNLPLVRTAYENSHVIKRFDAYDILNEGYPVEIREVNNKNGVIQSSWETYKNKFITDDGRVIDPMTNNITTSEGQSYALLRAVWFWEGDQETFDRVLAWTVNNLQQDSTHLFSWLYGTDDDDITRILDTSTATDADEDIALALLFAYKRWGQTRYLEYAHEVIDNLWKQQVIEIDGIYYLTSGAHTENGYLINPSYFSPAWYRVFSQVDTSHDWNKLADDTYLIINRLTKSSPFSDENYLIPNWFLLTSDGEYKSAEQISRNADVYGYDAFRLMWRLAHDVKWFNNTQAKIYLTKVTPFFESQWDDDTHIEAVFSMNGTPVSNFDDLSTYVGALSALYIANPEKAIDIYSEYFWPYFRNGFWGEKNNYYMQNWAWFGTALYADNTPNLWQTQLTQK